MKKRRIIISILGVAALILAALSPILWFLTAALRPPAAPVTDTWPAESWRTSTLEEQGLNSAKLAQGLLQLREQGEAIDSLTIIRNGYLVMDAHFAPYDGTFPHDLASVTKSITTTLVAIAAEQGKLDLDAAMVSFFPERTIANMDERKARITVRDLMAMRNGMESGCLEGDEPTLDAMRSQPDWIQAALDRPMVADPGSTNCYDSPGMHILSAVLQKAAGMTELEFAQKYLFGPLGIKQVIWRADPQGFTHGWGDLYLLPEDSARIGYLWLNRGRWNDRQIVSEAWVLDSVRMHSRFPDGEIGYGYGWWITPTSYMASGRGGQAIRVYPQRNTILMVNGSYFDFAELEKWLLPALFFAGGSRPANPQGQADLAAALVEIQKSNATNSVTPPAELIATISGQTYQCEPNAIQVETAKIDFSDPSRTVLTTILNGVEKITAIGMDGRYIQASNGEANTGFWKDAITFEYDTFDIGGLHQVLAFHGNALSVTIPELDLTVSCHQQNP
jgi:CubicO group peptidase (beta-lactamase class C family)